MLNTISKTKNPTFTLGPPPPSRKKNVITAELHRSSDGSEFVPFYPVQEGDYTKIATGVSTSEGQFVPMDNFTSASKASSNFEITAEFCSTSPEPFLLVPDCDEHVSMQQQDSSAPYFENNEEMSSVKNEHEQLLTVKGYTDNIAHVSPPSLLYSSERSSANCQGEDYVGVEHAILPDTGNVTAESTDSHLKNDHQTNQNSTCYMI